MAPRFRDVDGRVWDLSLVQGDGDVPTEPPSDGLIQVRPGEVYYGFRNDGVDIDVPMDWEFERYSYREVETLMPSFEGAEVGMYSDALVRTPHSEIADVVRVFVPEDAEPGEHAGFRVVDEPMGDALPIIAELESYKCLQAYFKATGDVNNWAMQREMTRKYIDLLQSFGVSPFKCSATYYPSDIEASPWGGTEGSYADFVLNQANATVYVGSREVPPADFMNSLRDWQQRTGRGFVFYGIDEAGSGPSGLTEQDALNRIDYIRSFFNDFSIIQTGVPHESYRTRHNIATCVPNVWSLQDSEAAGEYPSCMANGNCTNKTNINDVAPRTDAPVMVLEGDILNDFERSVRQAQGRQFMLYFNTTQNLLTCWEPGGLYNEGGNGDGTLLYYDPQTGDPLPSRRLMHLHIAQQKIAKGL